jgi:hypothetical protein
MSSRAFPALTLSLLAAATLLSGCGMGVANTDGGTSPLAISGHIMGGNQPVTGATIQLYEAKNAGYGAVATARLPTGDSAKTTGAGGSFTITGLYHCDSDADQVYLVATGGNPGLIAGTYNDQLALMVALGPCSALPSVSNLVVNEVTTVAAVWALAPFMTAYDHVGTSSGNAVGLVNAFGMANNLASFVSGTSPGAAPAGSTIPTAEINSLANSLAYCVNSRGTAGGDPNCGNLIAATTVGTKVPKNTIEIALAIAQHPSNNVGTIIDYGGGTAVAFQPTLGAAPNDLTIAATFGLGSTARETGGMAFDAAGDLWVVATDALYELSPTGAVTNSYPSMAGNAVAIDPSGNIWVGAASKTLLQMISTLPGAPVSHTVTLDGGNDIQSLALDGNGNAWYSCTTCGTVYKYNTSTTANTGYVATGVARASSISIDPTEQVWLGSFDTSATVSVFSNGGTPVTNSPFSCGSCGDSGNVANDSSGNAWIVGRNLTRMTGTGSETNIDGIGGLFNPSAVSIDGAGNAWVTNTASNVLTEGGAKENGGLSEFTNAGAPVTPSTGYVSDSLAAPQSVAVDGSGNVWLRNSGSTDVTAFVGVGAPAATPLALAIKNGTLGSGPGGGGPGGVVTGFRQ